MNVPAHNVMHALRRFVGLRSAWRRSLAMEPRERVVPGASAVQESRPGDGACGEKPPRDHCGACTCHV